MMRDMKSRSFIGILKRCFNLNRYNKVIELPEGLLFRAEMLGLEMVVPRWWRVGANHELMTPSKLFADTKGRIVSAIGCGLECCSYGFLIGRYDSLIKRFYALEAVAPGEEWNISHIMVYTRWDRTMGACGLKANHVKNKINHLYFHEAYDDEPYRQSGVQTLILKVDDYPILKRLVEQALKTWRNAIAYADKFMEDFVRDKAEHAKEIYSAMEQLFDVEEFSGVKELVIVPDEDSTPLRIVHHNGTIGTLEYHHDSLGAKCCIEDMKAIMDNPELVIMDDVDDADEDEPEDADVEAEADSEPEGVDKEVTTGEFGIGGGESDYLPRCYSYEVGV